MSPLLHLPPRKKRRAARAVLVLGGCRSGKTAWAEAQALSYARNRAEGRAPVYLATAVAAPADTAMQQRIARHQAGRSALWRTVELGESACLSGTLTALFQETPPPAAVLVDCLTVWLSGLMLNDLGQDAILERVEQLAQGLKQRTCPVFLISNETGLGVSPATALGNDFRDCNGLLNQKLVKDCDEVFFIVSGLSLKLKCANEKR